MTLPDEYVDVERIEDFEEWVRRLEGAEWDFIATYPRGANKYLEFRRFGEGWREFIQFVFRGKASIGRVRLYCSRYIVVEDGVVGFERMRVKVEVYRLRDGLSDINVNVVEFRWCWR
jgi:hypothetical protein